MKSVYLWPPAPGEATSAYDASRAPRLDAVVKEVMRLTPPVGGFFRRTLEPIALAGVLVPADRVLQVSIAASHRHGSGTEDMALGPARGSAWARRWPSWRSACWRWACSSSSA